MGLLLWDCSATSLCRGLEVVTDQARLDHRSHLTFMGLGLEEDLAGPGCGTHQCMQVPGLGAYHARQPTAPWDPELGAGLVGEHRELSY